MNHQGLDAINVRFPQFRAVFTPPDPGASEVVLSISGDVADEGAACLFKEIEAAILSRPMLVSLVVDLSELRYASSTAIGGLMSLYGLALRKEISFCVANPSKQLVSLFSLLGLSSFLPMAPRGSP
ncbi:MAG: STAS domain-containing protein [Spirochaetaceae bacterium]|nr:STAS domain-containing protein [Spirochaetaceae bacterium]